MEETTRPTPTSLVKEFHKSKITFIFKTGTLLLGLYPWTSLMSHNCIANTKITTREDFSYVCEATIPIKAGEEIVTNYHHYHYQFYGTPYRRADLKGTWSFDCVCSRCQDPTEYGTYVSAMICDACKFGHILPMQPTNYQVSRQQSQLLPSIIIHNYQYRCRATGNVTTVRPNSAMRSLIPNWPSTRPT